MWFFEFELTGVVKALTDVDDAKIDYIETPTYISNRIFSYEEIFVWFNLHKGYRIDFLIPRHELMTHIALIVEEQIEVFCAAEGTVIHPSDEIVIIVVFKCK